MVGQSRGARATLTAAVTVVALAAAGCTAQSVRNTADKAVDHTESITAALSRVTARTQKLGSARLEMTIDRGSGSPVSMTGVYSWGKGAAFDITMDTVAAQLDSVQDDPRIRAKMVKGAYYYGVDPQPEGLLKGKHWLRVDVAAVLGQSGADSVQGNADPTAGLRYFALSKNTKDLGAQTIRGTKTRHYHAKIDKDNIGTLKNALTKKDKKTLLSSLTGSVDSVTVDVWVDGKNLPVRLGEKFGKVKVTMDFLSFGSTRTITVPPASDTADFTDQLSK